MRHAQWRMRQSASLLVGGADLYLPKMCRAQYPRLPNVGISIGQGVFYAPIKLKKYHQDLFFVMPCGIGSNME